MSANRTVRRKKPRLILICLIGLLLLCGVFFGSKIILRRVFQQKYTAYVGYYSEKYGLDKNLVYAFIYTESGFRTQAVSSSDACGLMQLLPDTFVWLQTKDDSDVSYMREDLFRPEVNIEYGCLFLSILQQKFGSVENMAGAYHAGINAMERWLSDSEYSDDGIQLKSIPYRDTALYVRKILRNYQIYQWLYAEQKG